MKITMESTNLIIDVQVREDRDPIECRLWEGETASGIKVQCLIARIAVSKLDDCSQFERELLEQRAPLAVDPLPSVPLAFPLKMVL